MTLRRAKALSWMPSGVVDSVDGTAAPKGAMTSLSNLVPDPSTDKMFVPRVASIELENFSSFTDPTGVSVLLVVGDLAYGMISSSDYTNKDDPFVYNLATNTFLTISGKSSANLPTTQATTGDWVPPTMEIIGGRLIITHPGYGGSSSGYYFGWLDISGFTTTTLGNVSNGSPTITGFPNIAGVEVGMTAVGTNIPANTKVLSTANVVLSPTGETYSGATYINNVSSLSEVAIGQEIEAGGVAETTTITGVNTNTPSTTGTTNSSTSITNVASSAGWVPGQTITGSGIPANTILQSISGTGPYTFTISNAATSSASGVDLSGSGNVITISAAATASASNVTLNITGATITLSANATASSSQESITIAGGTAAAPLYGAGNMTTYPLPSVPSWVQNFNNRAYYGVGNQCYYSDVLVPTNAANAGQALTIGDTTPVICAESMPFSSAFGGVQQSLIIFKELGIYQIQGDAATSNLSLQTMSTGTGCKSPRSLANTPEGLAFVSAQGMRFITLVGTISPPIGDHGSGIAVPFINALYPTRISAAYNADTYRVSVQNGAVSQTPWQDWWYDITRKVWTGPHTFPSVEIQPWENTFVMVPQSTQAGLWKSNVYPNSTDGYTENGAALSWNWQTVSLPDTGQMAMNSIVETSIGFGCYTEGQILNFLALNDNQTVIDQVQVNEQVAITIWGSFTWGAADWLGGYLPYQQHLVPWSVPLVANQFSIQVNGFSASGFKIGTLFLRYQELGYMIQT